MEIGVRRHFLQASRTPRTPHPRPTPLAPTYPTLTRDAVCLAHPTYPTLIDAACLAHFGSHTRARNALASRATHHTTVPPPHVPHPRPTPLARLAQSEKHARAKPWPHAPHTTQQCHHPTYPTLGRRRLLGSHKAKNTHAQRRGLTATPHQLCARRPPRTPPSPACLAHPRIPHAPHRKRVVSVHAHAAGK